MQRMWLTIIAVSLIIASCPSTEAAQLLWQKFIPQKRQALSTASEDSTLTKENGPWLIMATSFNGEDAEQQARNLVAEIRTEYGLPAFYYGMTFQIGGEGKPRQRARYLWLKDQTPLPTSRSSRTCRLGRRVPIAGGCRSSKVIKEDQETDTTLNGDERF